MQTSATGINTVTIDNSVITKHYPDSVHVCEYIEPCLPGSLAHSRTTEAFSSYRSMSIQHMNGQQ